MSDRKNARASKFGSFLGSRILPLAASLVLALLAASPSRADMIWGANGHPFTAYSGVTLDEQLDTLKKLGMTAYRVNISSTDSIPRLAELVAKAKARGIRILPVITPPFDLDKESVDALYSKSYELAWTLADRFKNEIRVWELGNELENYAIITACEMQDDGIQYNCEWGPAGGAGPMEYFGPRWAKVSAELHGLSDAMVAVDPTIRKAIGTAGWGHLGAFTRMKEDGIRWDISVWHYYEGDPVKALRFLQRFGHPVWVTEFNHSGGSTGGEQAQADGLVRMMTLLRKYHRPYRVDGAFIYELFDEPYWAPSFEAHMGLMTLKPRGKGRWQTGRTKPAFAAVKAFLSAERAGSRQGSDTASVTEVNALPRQESAAAPEAGPPGCDPRMLDARNSNPANQVAYSYCLILRRMPTPAEQWRYVTALRKDHDVGKMLAGLLRQANAKGQYLGDAASHSDYVTRAYRLLLRREPDGGGMADYASRLDSGDLTRQQLDLALIESDEFKTENRILFPPDSAKK